MVFNVQLQTLPATLRSLLKVNQTIQNLVKIRYAHQVNGFTFNRRNETRSHMSADTGRLSCRMPLVR